MRVAALALALAAAGAAEAERASRAQDVWEQRMPPPEEPGLFRRAWARASAYGRYLGLTTTKVDPVEEEARETASPTYSGAGARALERARAGNAAARRAASLVPPVWQVVGANLYKQTLPAGPQEEDEGEDDPVWSEDDEDENPVWSDDDEEEVPPCGDPEPGTQCFKAVTWALEKGLVQHPKWYGPLWRRGLTPETATFRDVQRHIAAQKDPQGCVMPCEDAPASPPSPRRSSVDDEAASPPSPRRSAARDYDEVEAELRAAAALEDAEDEVQTAPVTLPACSPGQLCSRLQFHIGQPIAPPEALPYEGIDSLSNEKMLTRARPAGRRPRTKPPGRLPRAEPEPEPEPEEEDPVPEEEKEESPQKTGLQLELQATLAARKLRLAAQRRADPVHEIVSYGTGRPMTPPRERPVVSHQPVAVLPQRAGPAPAWPGPLPAALVDEGAAPDSRAVAVAAGATVSREEARAE